MTKQNYLISVCMSVYNDETFLKRCIDSVIEQDIERMELVLVDDGSTDNTLQIMKEYKDCYPEKSIKIIQQEHAGLAQGRWTGVKNSAGEYVTFLDADDYLLPGAYKTIIEFMESNENVDIYEFQTIREGYFSKSPYSGIMDASQVLKDYFNGVEIPVNYWLRWFRRELFNEQVFPKNISLHEDAYAFPCILNRANSIAYIGQPLHVHTKDNKASIMNRHKKAKGQEYFEREKVHLLSIPYIERNIGQDQLNKAYKESFLHYKMWIYRDFVLMDVKGVSYTKRLRAIIDTLNLDMNIKRLERYISKNIYANCKKNCAIRFWGLHNIYRLSIVKDILLKRVFRVIKKVYNKLMRLGRMLSLIFESILFSKEMTSYCSCCRLKLKHFVNGHFQNHPERYNPKRYANTRQDVICPFCGSLPRHRILALWCEQNIKKLKKADILYFAPEQSMMLWMRKKRIRCHTADMYHKADLMLDIQNTGLPTNSYDFVFCNHVLEHVDDFRTALKEVCRILKPGGSLICSFPIDPLVKTVDEDETAKTDNEHYKRYGQVDHKRVFGVCADQLLVQAGFTVEVINGNDYSVAILPVVGPADYDINQLFCCSKAL